jgi:hypothetical protein
MKEGRMKKCINPDGLMHFFILYTTGDGGYDGHFKEIGNKY